MAEEILGWQPMVGSAGLVADRTRRSPDRWWDGQKWKMRGRTLDRLAASAAGVSGALALAWSYVAGTYAAADVVPLWAQVTAVVSLTGVVPGVIGFAASLSAKRGGRRSRLSTIAFVTALIALALFFIGFFMAANPTSQDTLGWVHVPVS